MPRRRKFRDAEATQPTLAVEGGAFIAAMYEAEDRATKLQLEGEALVEHRRTFIRPITADFDVLSYRTTARARPANQSTRASS